MGREPRGSDSESDDDVNTPRYMDFGASSDSSADDFYTLN